LFQGAEVSEVGRKGENAVKQEFQGSLGGRVGGRQNGRGGRDSRAFQIKGYVLYGTWEKKEGQPGSCVTN